MEDPTARTEETPPPRTASAGNRDSHAGDAAPPRRPPWSQRTPELVAVVGVALLLVAVVGGVAHSWDLLGDAQRGGLLLAAAAGLTTAGVWADDRAASAAARRTVTLVWAGATALVVAGVDLVAGVTAAPGRGVAAAAGVAGVAHAGALLASRRRGAPGQHVVLFAAAVYAIGPAGAAPGSGTVDNAAGWSFEGLAATLLAPLPAIAGEQTMPVAAVLPNAVALAAVGAAWAAVGARSHGRVRHTGVALAAVALAWAAMLANSADEPLGAAVALAIVLGLFIGGVAAEDGLVAVLGAVGTVVAGLRVLTAVVSGVEAVIVVVAALGVVMLAAALWMLRRRGSG